MKTREQLYKAVAKDIIEQMQLEIQNTEGEGDGEPGKIKQYTETWYNQLEELLASQMMELSTNLANGYQIAENNSREEAYFIAELVQLTTAELYYGFSPLVFDREPDVD